jgi:parallel beta-helix repeat protein
VPALPRPSGGRVVSRRTALRAGVGVATGLAGGSAVGRVRAQTDRGRYFLAPWGSDANPGTRSAPFATLAPVANDGDYEAEAGAEVVFRAGTYRFDTSDAFSRQDGLTVRTDGEGRVTIDGTRYDADVQAGGLLQFFRCRDVTVRSLELRNAPGAAIKFVRSTRPTVVNCLAHHNGNAGVYYGDTAGGTIRRCTVYGNYSPEGHVPGGASDGIAVTAADGRRSVGGLIERCDVHHNSDDGIDLFHARDVVVRYNRAWANGFGTDGEPVGEAPGKGIKLGAPRSRNDGGHVVHSNLAWFNGHAGIGWNGANRPVACVNNTCVFNGRKPWLKGSIGDDFEFIDADVRSLVANNVALSVHHTVDRFPDDRHLANAWQLGVRRVDDVGFASVAVDDAGYPTAAGFLELSGRSPLRGAGVDVRRLVAEGWMGVDTDAGLAGFGVGGPSGDGGAPDVGAPVVDVGPAFVDGPAVTGDGDGRTSAEAPTGPAAPRGDRGPPTPVSDRPVPFDTVTVWAATLAGVGYLLRRRLRGRRVDRE